MGGTQQYFALNHRTLRSKKKKLSCTTNIVHGTMKLVDGHIKRPKIKKPITIMKAFDIFTILGFPKRLSAFRFECAMETEEAGEFAEILDGDGTPPVFFRWQTSFLCRNGF